MDMVVSQSELLERRQDWRKQGRRVVFTNGCFDLIHPGHVRLLETARAQGDILVVAVNSDESVRRLKGPNRPILPQTDRAEVLAAMAAVDAVTVFSEDTPCALLERLLPDVLVKGADWSHWIAGREIVEGSGGEVVAIPFEEHYSTTDLVQTIRDQNS